MKKVKLGQNNKQKNKNKNSGKPLNKFLIVCKETNKKVDMNGLMINFITNSVILKGLKSQKREGTSDFY